MKAELEVLERSVHGKVIIQVMKKVWDKWWNA